MEHPCHPLDSSSLVPHHCPGSRKFQRADLRVILLSSFLILNGCPFSGLFQGVSCQAMVTQESSLTRRTVILTCSSSTRVATRDDSQCGRKTSDQVSRTLISHTKANSHEPMLTSQVPYWRLSCPHLLRSPAQGAG